MAKKPSKAELEAELKALNVSVPPDATEQQLTELAIQAARDGNAVLPDLPKERQPSNAEPAAVSAPIPPDVAKSVKVLIHAFKDERRAHIGEWEGALVKDKTQVVPLHVGMRLSETGHAAIIRQIGD